MITPTVAVEDQSRGADRDADVVASRVDETTTSIPLHPSSIARPIPEHIDRDKLSGTLTRIDLLDAEPDAVTPVAQLSRRFAPPTLVNTEGERPERRPALGGRSTKDLVLWPRPRTRRTLGSQQQ